jgi:hypothetical protein
MPLSRKARAGRRASAKSRISGQLAGCVGRGADAGQGFRHSGTTRTRPYDMAAAFMLFQVHGWGIHAV